MSLYADRITADAEIRQVEAFVSPAGESVKVVTEWLAESGLKAEIVSPSGDMLRMNVSIKAANALLGANYTEYKIRDRNTTIVRTTSYTVPDNVREHLKFIHPTTQCVHTFIHLSHADSLLD